MSNCQAMMLMAYRVSKLYEEGKATIGMAALAKAFTTDRAREITKLGREMMGGNGIVFDNYVMKAHADIEALYTYEGTYDINALIAAREITGIASFKTYKKKN